MKILVAIDCSSYAGEVVDQLAMRTWPDKSEVRLITVIDPCPNWEAAQEFMHQGSVILDERVAGLQKRLPNCTITGQVLEGHAAETINEAALDWGAQLIVIGSHGDTGTRRSHIGSVAAAVVNEAPCSVEVIKLMRKGGKPKGATGAVAGMSK